MEFWKNYGILKRKFHIWKNYGRTYGKTMEFLFWSKKVRAFLKKKMGGKYVRTWKCSFNFCCFGYHFTKPSSKNLQGYTASLLLGRVNTCYLLVYIFRPLILVGYDSKLSCRRIDLGDDYSLILGQDQSRSRCPRPHKVRA